MFFNSRTGRRKAVSVSVLSITLISGLFLAGVQSASSASAYDYGCRAGAQTTDPNQGPGMKYLERTCDVFEEARVVTAEWYNPALVQIGTVAPGPHIVLCQLAFKAANEPTGTRKQNVNNIWLLTKSTTTTPKDAELKQNGMGWMEATKIRQGKNNAPIPNVPFCSDDEATRLNPNLPSGVAPKPVVKAAPAGAAAPAVRRIPAPPTKLDKNQYGTTSYATQAEAMRSCPTGTYNQQAGGRWICVEYFSGSATPAPPARVLSV